MEIVAKFRARDAEKFGINVRVGNGQKTVIGYDVFRGGILRRPNQVRLSRLTQRQLPQRRVRPAGPRSSTTRSSCGSWSTDLRSRCSPTQRAGRNHRSDLPGPVQHPRDPDLLLPVAVPILQKITIWQLRSIWKK